MNLSHFEKSMLAALVEAGSGTVDHSGRVCVGPTKQPIAGDSRMWLKHVALGFVAGERGLILPTEAGREAAASHLSGKVRESRG